MHKGLRSVPSQQGAPKKFSLFQPAPFLCSPDTTPECARRPPWSSLLLPASHGPPSPCKAQSSLLVLPRSFTRFPLRWLPFPHSLLGMAGAPGFSVPEPSGLQGLETVTEGWAWDRTGWASGLGNAAGIEGETKYCLLVQAQNHPLLFSFKDGASRKSRTWRVGSQGEQGQDLRPKRSRREESGPGERKRGSEGRRS